MSALAEMETTSAASDPIDRRKGIGGSDIAVILGLSPYKTPLDLYLQKIGAWSDEGDSEAAEWGRIMEPVLAMQYARKYGINVARADGVYTPGGEILPAIPSAVQPLLGTLVHPEYPWIRGHVDGIGLDENGEASHVCEFKTADSRLSGHWGEPDSDQVPEPYLVQVQWYEMLAELETGHVAALIGGNHFGRFIVERDNALIDLMLDSAFRFWERVLREDPPEPEPGERGKQSLARLYPTSAQGKEIAAAKVHIDLARELHQAREEAKRAEARKVTLENEIKLLMADASRLTLGPKTYVGWANTKDSQVTDWQAVAREAGASKELILDYTTSKPGSRRFLCQGFDKLFDTNS